MKILLISVFLGTLGLTALHSVEKEVAEMPELSVAIHEKGKEELTFLEAEKAFYSGGEKFFGYKSRFRVRGGEAPVKIQSGEDIVIYARGKEDTKKVPFTLAKMEVIKGKKRVIENTPKNNPDNDIPIQRIACDGENVDAQKRIVKKIPTETLEPGVYGVVFKKSTHKFFPMDAPTLSTDVYSFEVVE